MYAVENRYRTLKRLQKTTSAFGGIAGKVLPVMCMIFVSMGIFLSFRTASESGFFGIINETYKINTTVRLLSNQQSESGSGTLWSGYDSTGGSSQGINLKDIRLSTNSVAVAYGTLSKDQLDYLTEYVRATQQAGDSADVPPWLLIGLQSASRDETPVASGVYMPHPGITAESWGKEYDSELLSFLRMSDSVVEEIETGYTTYSSTRSGQHGLLRGTYDANFSRKSVSADRFNFYNSAYSAVSSFVSNYQYIDDIQTWYSVGRDSSSKEPTDMITFEGMDKETKWIMAALMLVEGEANELYESIPIDMISTFCLQLNTLIGDRGFFEDYVAQAYGKLEYDSAGLKLEVGRELVINYFISKLGWKISESVISSEGLNRDAYVSSDILLSGNPVAYPGVSMGAKVQEWGKRASTYELLGVHGVPNSEHYLQNSLSFTDVDGSTMMTLNIDSIVKFVRVIYLGKYYSGVSQYVVNHEQQRLSQNSAQVTGGFNISVMPGQDTGVMYYRSYKKMKELENSVITDKKLLYEIESYQQGKVPTDIYEQINFDTADKVGENYFGFFNEAGWKSTFPLFSQESDPIANNPYWGVGTLGSSGCGLYSLVSLAHGLGLGKEPIPKMKGDTNNGLNEYGFLDPEKVRQIYKDKSWTTTIDHSKVRDLMGYEIQAYSFGYAGDSLTADINKSYEAMWSFLKSGIPFVIVVGNKSVDGVTYWGESISTKFTTGGHYIILINGAVRNGVRYVEIADCYGGKPTKNNNYAWYNFDTMKSNLQFRHFAYTLSNLKGDGDYVVDLSSRIVQLGDRFVLPDDKLIVAVVKDDDGVEHVRVYRDAWVFLDIVGLAVSAEIDKSGAPAMYDKGVVLGIGSPVMRKGIVNRSDPNSKPSYESLDLGDPEITPYSDIE